MLNCSTKIPTNRKKQMLEIEIYEVDYSVSPGGVNCWEANVQGYGESKCYSDFKSAGEALNHMLLVYPEQELNVNVMSLATYFKLEEVNA